MYGLIDDDAPDFKPCERTVRLCIEALTSEFGARFHARRSIELLQALLPDPAKALAPFVAPEPMPMERLEQHHNRTISAMVEYFNKFMASLDTGKIHNSEGR